MKIVFISNYFTHHQKSLSEALAQRGDYAFIATEPVSPERLAMGWGAEEPDYVCHYDRDPGYAQVLMENADAVIIGSAPEHLIRSRINGGQLVLRYAERPLKKGSEWRKYVPRLVKWHLQNPPGKPVYMLCASAFTAGDYARFGLFRGKTFRWGYFPETKHYDDVIRLLDAKKPASILWAGRFLDWKHPDDAVRVAVRLKEAGIRFEMNIIGRGEMEDTLRKMIEDARLQDCVHLLGAMGPEEVRRHMEQSQIFLFTSDRQEGWGAVLNESMNSGCAVVASDAIGAVPFLLRDGENGFVYHSGNQEELFQRVCELLMDSERMRQMGSAAYETITSRWNGEAAAQRLISLVGVLLAGNDGSGLFSDGPCSPSPIIREDWYRA